MIDIAPIGAYNTDMEIIIERFQTALKNSGLTKEELARATNIPLKRIERYLTDRTPKARDLAKLAPALKVPADYLLGLTS